MFAATIQDSFDFGARADTGLYPTHLIGEPVPGDRLHLAGAMRLVTRVDNRQRTRNCLTAEPLPGAPPMLVAIKPRLDAAERQQARYRRVATKPSADLSLLQRHPAAQPLDLRLGKAETAGILEGIRLDGRTAILHLSPRPDIKTGQPPILLDADNEPAAVILTTHVETRRAADIPQALLRRTGHADIDEWRSHYSDLSDDAPILCHGLQLIEVIG